MVPKKPILNPTINNKYIRQCQADQETASFEDLYYSAVEKSSLYHAYKKQVSFNEKIIKIKAISTGLRENQETASL